MDVGDVTRFLSAAAASFTEVLHAMQCSCPEFTRRTVKLCCGDELCILCVASLFEKERVRAGARDVVCPKCSMAMRADVQRRRESNHDRVMDVFTFPSAPPLGTQVPRYALKYLDYSPWTARMRAVSVLVLCKNGKLAIFDERSSVAAPAAQASAHTIWLYEAHQTFDGIEKMDASWPDVTSRVGVLFPGFRKNVSF